LVNYIVKYKEDEQIWTRMLKEYSLY